MQIRNENHTRITNDMMQQLIRFRTERGFNAADYIHKKAEYLNNYMAECGLSACVLGVSGGIDSAVVLGILTYASKLPESPIKKIVPVLIPCYTAVTGQEEAVKDGLKVTNHFKQVYYIADITDAVKDIDDQVLSDTDGNSWSKGQLTSNLRTATLYHYATRSTQDGNPAIVIGTTNYSEGGYIGFFGKASDGLVDIQLISDIYKYEVYQVANALKIPEDLIQRVPTGDMFDSAPDEQVFGFSYNFLELWMEVKRCGQINLFMQNSVAFQQMAENVEKMHNYNSHKYVAKSPAIHLDLFDVSFPGGWNNNPPVVKERPKFTKLVNKRYGFEMSRISLPLVQQTKAEKIFETTLSETNNYKVTVVKDVLPFVTVKDMKEFLDKEPFVVAGIDGRALAVGSKAAVGSYRMTTVNEDFAELLYGRVRRYLDDIRTNDGKLWIPVAVSPVFRYIRYDSKGILVPHYDAPFVETETRKTFKSVVLYLTEGETRFIFDHSRNLPDEDRNFDDWTRRATDSEVLAGLRLDPGSALIFDHRLLHDSGPVVGAKTIIRTDIFYEHING